MKTTTTTTTTTVDTEEFIAKYTEVVAILDRSGSMNSIVDDAIGGINNLIESQQKETDKTTMTAILFDDHYDVIYEGKDIKDVKLFDRNTFVPRGMTALNDAIGRTLVNIKERHSKLPKADRPDNVVVAILTDGHNNASTEYTKNHIKEMIELYEKEYNYKFLYIAANQDAFAVGSEYGFNAINSMTISNNSKGVERGFLNFDCMVKESKRCLKTSDTYATYSCNSIKTDSSGDVI